MFTNLIHIHAMRVLSSTAGRVMMSKKDLFTSEVSYLCYWDKDIRHYFILVVAEIFVILE
jgi:hypothetical protein